MSKRPFVGDQMVEKIYFSEFVMGKSIFVKHMQFDVYDVVKYKGHAFVKLLIMQHQMAAKIADISMNVEYIFSFIIGALEINWALSYQLNILPIFKLHATDIHGLIIQ
uniref:Uncharacterized protein n=1 Tax=Romanomermis culicivorax TaxID=13658 RepID=A0A915K7U3_ROMCU